MPNRPRTSDSTIRLLGKQPLDAMHDPEVAIDGDLEAGLVRREAQNGKQPVVSGMPSAWRSHSPVHTWPARQPAA